MAGAGRCGQRQRQRGGDGCVLPRNNQADWLQDAVNDGVDKLCGALVVPWWCPWKRSQVAGRSAVKACSSQSFQPVSVMAM